MSDILKYCACAMCLWLCCALFAGAASSKAVFVVAADTPESLDLARYYCAERGVPQANIIILKLPKNCGFVSRKTYLEKIEKPVFDALASRGGISATFLGADDALGRPAALFSRVNLDFLVICKGVPWGILSPRKEKKNSPDTETASVDGEIAARFLPRKSFNGFVKNPSFGISGEAWRVCGIVRTARLDGASFADAKNLVSSAKAAEKRGLRGRVYIDKSRYAPLGDKWLDEAAKILSAQGFDVSVESARRLMGYGDRADAVAVYFGWYAASAYGWFASPEFRCADGMIGWHIYSFSAHNFADARKWTPAIVSKNAAATDGNVFEPFLPFSRNIDVFARMVFAEKMTPAEAAYAALPVLGWQNVYVGDPLYNPHSVPLDAQIAEVDAGNVDALSQYSLIRKANLISAESGAVQAVEFLQKYAGKVPDTALLWRIAQLSGDADKSAKTARLLLGRSIHNSAAHAGLAFELAEYLERRGDASAMLGLCAAVVRAHPDDFPLKLYAARRAKRSAEKFSADLPREFSEIISEADRAAAAKKSRK